MYKKILICFICLLICSAAYGQKPTRVVVFPFRINSSTNLDYLRERILSILIAQMEKSDKVSFVEESVVHSILKERSEKETDKDIAKRVGKEVDADFVIWGSLTKIGESISLDAELLGITGDLSPERIHAQGRSLDMLDSVIAQLAKEINLRLLDKDIITKISIRGNNRIEEDAIKSVMKSIEGDILSQKSLRNDLKRIYEMGYFEDVNIATEDTPAGKEVTFIVSEKPSIKRIEISGVRFLEKEDVEDVIDIKAHSILNFTRIENSVKNILGLYRDKGYWAARVDYKVYYLTTKEAIVDFMIEENKTTKIKEVRFTGNKVYTDEDLKDVIDTTEKGFFSWLTDSGVLNEDVLDQDTDKISSFYGTNGYINIKVGKPEVTHDNKWIYIVIPIDEGEQFRIGKVDIRGDLIEERETLLKGLNIAPGKVFNRKLLREDIAYLTDKYTGVGYAFADVTPLTSINKESQSVDLIFDLRKGKMVYFDRISISGNTITRDKVIRREMKVVEGDLYNKEKLAKSYKNINRLGYFEEISFNTEKGGSDTKLDLNIKVKEKPTGAISLGAGYSSVDSVIGMVNISKNNLFGRGQKVFLAASLGGKSRTYNFGFTEPWLLDTRVSAGFDLYDTKRDYTDYDKEARGGAIRFGFPITEEYTRVYVTYKHENVDITDIEDTAADAIKDVEGNTTTSSVLLALIRDTRDSTIFPSEGSENSITVEYAGGFMGGDNYFTKYIGDTKWYFPLFWDTVFMTRGRIGFGHGNQGRELPLFERFFLGGINTIRGFESYSIGPKDPETGDVIGGYKELLFNQEFVFPLVEEAGVKGVIFFDAGNAFDKNDDYNLNQLRTSAGVGIRWYSPIGPLRLEWGYNIDPEHGEKRSDWEFAIGMMF